jgi:general nucleoside transport system ATP-binding protein
MGELLRIENMTRTFPGVLANDDVTIEVQKGEILALLGENGAGKTTLMNCLYGLLKPDSGRFIWKDNQVEIPDSHAAVRLGIGMVHQHFMLVPVLSVVENVSMGRPSTRGLLLDLDVIEERLTKLSEEYGLEVNPRDIIWHLPVGVQQRVEILKALYSDIDLLILDEPTAVLTPKEVQDLFKVLKRLTDSGMSIILITHKLEEVMAVSDRVTVLRDGKAIGTVNTSETDAHALACMMVGRDIVFDVHKPPINRGKEVLVAKNIGAENDRGLSALSGISFQLHEGEILGIAGVDGNGQRELEDVLCGLRPLTCGQFYLNEKEVSQLGPAELHKMGLAHIASDRHDRAVALRMTVKENLIANHIEFLPYSRKGIINHRQINHFAECAIDEFNIQTPSSDSLVSNLSGGNQQRVVLGSALGHDPKVLIAAQPTRGLDVGVTLQVYERLIKERTKGTAILLISTELQEIFRISDRIAVMYRGEFMGIVETSETNINEVGLMMAGIRLESMEKSTT